MTPIRHTVRAAVITAFSTALPGVQVERVWPGDEVRGEFVILGDTEGESTVPVFRGPPSPSVPLVRDDIFGIRVFVRAAAAGQTVDAAEDRVAAMYAACELALAQDPTLAALTGVISATVSSSLGPSVARTGDGAVGMWNFTINVHTRLS